jgi:hypothetical protein
LRHGRHTPAAGPLGGRPGGNATTPFAPLPGPGWPRMRPHGLGKAEGGARFAAGQRGAGGCQDGGRVFTGSLGILSEAIHSLLDTGVTAITLAAVRVSDRPPDDTHHFGHAKVESIAALTGTALLFVTTGWIVYEALHRLTTGETHVTVAWWAVAIVAGSIVIDFNRARALTRVSKATSSEALAADALHFRTDMWSSIVVLLGLGRRLGRLSVGRLGCSACGCRLRGARRLPPRQAHAGHPARCRAARHHGGDRAAGRRDPRRSRPQAAAGAAGRRDAVRRCRHHGAPDAGPSTAWPRSSTASSRR